MTQVPGSRLILFGIGTLCTLLCSIISNFWAVSINFRHFGLQESEKPDTFFLVARVITNIHESKLRGFRYFRCKLLEKIWDPKLTPKSGHPHPTDPLKKTSDRGQPVRPLAGGQWTGHVPHVADAVPWPRPHRGHGGALRPLWAKAPFCLQCSLVEVC